MTAHVKGLPVHAPINRDGIASDFARRALGRREARRLADLMDDAEKRARARLDVAKREAEEIFAHARAEAEAILARLPDFAAIEAAPAIDGKSALRAIRDAADTHGLPLAVVVGGAQHPRARSARIAAVKGVSEACPGMADAAIGALFSGMKAATVRRLRNSEGE